MEVKMSKIKGLLIKDLLQLKSYKKTLLIFMIIFALSAIPEENGVSVMLITMITLGFGMFSMASFSYDEMSKADRYILTLPITKKELVLAKYVLAIGFTILGSIIGILLTFIIAFAFQKEIQNWQEIVSMALGGILGISFIEAIQIPCIYKWGAERGRMQMLIVTAIVALLIGGLFFLGEKLNIALPTEEKVATFSTFIPFILVGSIVSIYFISYKIAYKIYSNKEV